MDPTIKAAVDTARENAKKKISLVMETTQTIAQYRQRLFDELSSQSSSSGSSTGDGSGGGWDG